MENEELLSLFRDLKEKDLRKQRIVIGESRFVAERMIGAGLKIIGGIGTGDNTRILEQLGEGRFPVLELSREEISTLAGYPFHRGMLVAAEEPDKKTISGYLEKRKGNDLVVFMPDPNIPENIGSVCRSAAALGAGAVILPGKGPYPFSRRVLRASMGTILTLPVLTLDDDIEKDIGLLKTAGYCFCGTSLNTRSVPLEKFKTPEKAVLLLGNEAFGLDPEWENTCDHLITLEMKNSCDSLNVAAAAGIFLYWMTLAQLR